MVVTFSLSPIPTTKMVFSWHKLKKSTIGTSRVTKRMQRILPSWALNLGWCPKTVNCLCAHRSLTGSCLDCPPLPWSATLEASEYVDTYGAVSIYLSYSGARNHDKSGPVIIHYRTVLDSDLCQGRKGILGQGTDQMNKMSYKTVSWFPHFKTAEPIVWQVVWRSPRPWGNEHHW